MIRTALSAALMVSFLAGGVMAEESKQEEVVVTAYRRTADDYADTPHVSLTRRADNLISTLEVVCDTRDEKLRGEEMRQTLRNLLASAAANGRIALSTGGDILVDFDETMLDRVIEPDGTRAEVSKATIVLKTAVSEGDTFDTATGRIKAFVDATQKAGRTELVLSEGWRLSLVGPERSRPELLKLIADDARQTAAAFGPTYDVALAGLQNQIEWYQSGQLDLSLYIRYAMTVTATEP